MHELNDVLMGESLSASSESSCPSMELDIITSPSSNLPVLEEDKIQPIRTLGHGVSGEVYLALAESSDGNLHHVAIKKWHEINQASEQECHIHTQLAHESIVQVLALITNPVCQLVMELGEGTLTDYLGNSPDFLHSLEIAVSLAEALCYLHGRNIIHRDIKSDNILFVGGKAKLSDFGFAAPCDEEGDAIANNQPIGTPLYMAPELWTGEPSSTRSDIFSFGIVLLELFRGKRINVQDPNMRYEDLYVTGVHYPELAYPRPYPPTPFSESRWYFFNITRRCGDLNPRARPSAEEIRDEVIQAQNIMLIAPN